MGDVNLVLIGRTGNGKSSTGNSILGYQAFQSKRSTRSVTKKCMLGSRTWNCRKINVIDTPGLFDTEANTEAKRRYIETEIVRCIELAKDGVHGFILVLSPNRFTDEEASAFEKTQYLFGPKILDYMTIVFSGGDQLREDPCFSLEEYVSDSVYGLKKIVGRCEKRVVVFDNKTTCERTKQCQVSDLMKIVDRNVEENGGCPYTNAVFEKAKSNTLELYYIQDNEYAKSKECQEQVKILKETMAKNLQETKERLDIERKESEAMLKCLEAQKDTFRDEICNLRKELSDARKKLTQIKEMEDDSSCKSCSIV